MAETTEAVVLPDTPAGRRLAETVALVRDGLVTEESLKATVAPSFLDAVGPAELVNMTGMLRMMLASHPLSYVNERSEFEVQGEWTAPDGAGLMLSVIVEEDGNHLIRGLGGAPLAPLTTPLAGVEDVIGAAPSTRADDDFPGELVAKVADAVAEWTRARQVPGVQVVVLHEGRRLAVNVGAASIDPRRPVTSETIFRAYSITKTLTATGLLLLHAEGRFDLDDAINPHLESYEVRHSDADSPDVTFRHLLTHSSGANSNFNHWVEEVQPVSTLLGPVLACDFVPGTKRAYSNAGYATIGQLVEDISGEPFADFMKERLLDPLGMTSSEYRKTNAVGDGWAVGYTSRRGGFYAASTDVPSVLGAGSLWTTADDLSRFLVAAMTGGSGVIPTAILDASFVASDVPGMEGVEQGLAWMMSELEGRTFAHHSGGGWGFNTTMWGLIGEPTGVIVLGNQEASNPDALASTVSRLLLTHS